MHNFINSYISISCRRQFRIQLQYPPEVISIFDELVSFQVKTHPSIPILSLLSCDVKIVEESLKRLGIDGRLAALLVFQLLVR